MWKSPGVHLTAIFRPDSNIITRKQHISDRPPSTPSSLNVAYNLYLIELSRSENHGKNSWTMLN